MYRKPLPSHIDMGQWFPVLDLNKISTSDIDMGQWFPVLTSQQKCASLRSEMCTFVEMYRKPLSHNKRYSLLARPSIVIDRVKYKNIVDNTLIMFTPFQAVIRQLFGQGWSMQIFGSRCPIMLSPHKINREKYWCLIFMLVNFLKIHLLNGGFIQCIYFILLYKCFVLAKVKAKQ
jgi:hypothetical protein